MAYYLTDDTAHTDPRWMVLAGGRVSLADQLFAFWHRLCGTAALSKHDGYLTQHEALAACRGRRKLLELLATPVLGERPLLHRRGDSCDEKNCLDASPPWIDGFDFRLCAFLKRNPSKAEKARNDAQKNDSRDKPLRDRVYARDGGCCRYCRSGPLARKGMGNAKDKRRALQFDHVDPDRAAGPDGDNYVTACARCNREKGQCTPAEADMVLLPVPTQAQRDAWAARGERLFDPGDPAGEAVDEPPVAADGQPHGQPPDNPQDNRHDNEQAVVGGVVSAVVSTSPPGAVPAGEVRLEIGEQPTTTTPVSASARSGTGRDGQPLAPVVRPFAVQPARTGTAPDIYHGRSRVPAHETDLPPPGGVP